MSDIPLKPVTPSTTQALTKQQPNTQRGDITPPSISQGDDASKISIPRTQSKATSSQDPDLLIGSLLKELKSSPSDSTAHSNLDPARAFALLNDTEE